MRLRFGDGDIPRPDFWHGYRVVPDRIEIWENRPHRLHHRQAYVRHPDGWRSSLLYP